MILNEFPTAEAQAQNLALKVGEDLVSLLKQKDLVTVCVPGGTTPALFLGFLSKISLNWSRVKVVLNDERWVPLNDPLSNEAMVRKVLLRNQAFDAQIVSLFDDGSPVDQAVVKFNQRISTVLPLDICVLGMGDDGHTASLFPAMLDLQEALNVNEAAALIIAQVPNKTEQRVSFNLSAILSAEKHYVLIKGQTKKAVIHKAHEAQSLDLPISHLLAATAATVYYTN